MSDRTHPRLSDASTIAGLSALLLVRRSPSVSYPAGRRPAQRFCAHCNDLLLRDEKWLCTTCYEIENNRPVAPPPPVNQERVLNLLRSYRLLCMSCGADMWVSLTRQRAQLLAKAGFKPCKMCRGALELI